jgi:formate hydrogenlyase subunit 6
MMLLPEALRNLVKRVFTRKYPKEKPILPHGFRGKLLHYPDRCIYCGLCAKYCPSNCITVDAKKKVWKHDVGQCLFCSQCVETCRELPKKDALAMGVDYELATRDRKKLVWESGQSRKKSV